MDTRAIRHMVVTVDPVADTDGNPFIAVIGKDCCMKVFDAAGVLLEF